MQRDAEMTVNKTLLRHINNKVLSSSDYRPNVYLFIMHPQNTDIAD